MKSDYYCNFEKVKKIRELDQVEVEMFLLEDEPSKNKRRRWNSNILLENRDNRKYFKLLEVWEVDPKKSNRIVER